MEKFTAQHKEWWAHQDKDDTGREGNLIGQTYGTAVYNIYVQRYTYPQDGFEPFNPVGSKSPDLDKWGKKCGCK